MGSSDAATLVKQAVDIVEVVSQVVSLKRVGNRHVGVCPFHQEKTPSFHVDSESQFYYCFGCGSGGDVLSFVMKQQNVSFGEALVYLADRYHVALPEWELGPAAAARNDAARKEQEELYPVLRVATDFFYDQLHHGEAGRAAREYVKQRGLPDEVVEAERLGYAPQQWDGMARHLQKLGIDPQLGLKAGLLAKSSKNEERLYDRFRNRLIFPIVNERGQVVAFGGRSLSAELQGEPKYLNSPETPVYQKGRMLYQLPRAREACRQVRQVVLVEGYMDLLAFHAQGFYRVAATLGTALTSSQVRLLSRIGGEVVLAYDGDPAGERAMLRALPLFLEEEVPVSCLRFPDGMDPDDFLRVRGLEAFHALLQQRQDLGVYVIRKTLEAWDGSTTGKGAVITQLQPLMEAVRQPVMISEYLRLVADRLGLSEDVVRQQLHHGKREAPKHAAPAPARVRRPVKPESVAGIEESILRVMIKYPELIGEVRSSEALAHFQVPALKVLAETLTRVPHPPEGELDPGAVYALLADAEAKDLFARFLVESCDLSEARLHINDWLQVLCKRKTKQERLRLRESLGEAERSGDEARVRSILAQIQGICSAKKG